MSLAARLRERTRPIARFGCVAIGTVYVLVGAVALLALAGVFTDHADENRIVRVVMEWPGGTLIVWTIIAGLVGYVIWRIIEVFADPYEFGSDMRGLFTRMGIGLSGLAYGFVAFSAARIALGAPGTSESSEQEQQLLVAEVLAWPGGAWWVGMAGAVLWIFAVVQIVLIVRRSYTIEIDMASRSAAMRRVIHGLAWAGYAARAVILGVIGYFLVRAAVTVNPEEVGDTDTAFDFIGGGVVGDSAFFLVAMGTVGYGIFMYLCAAFYKFRKGRSRAGDLRPS
jgi:hypothetical protein